LIDDDSSGSRGGRGGRRGSQRVPVPVPAEEEVPLSFGNILTKFPEFPLQVLQYIADRKIWDAIASSNKKIYEQSKDKANLPPWPKNFKLHVPGYNSNRLRNPVWSPDGTQIACIIIAERNGMGVRGQMIENRIVIFDQRRGLLRFHRHDDDADCDCDINNTEIGWIAHTYMHHPSLSLGTIPSRYPSLKFSPDGSFLISSCNKDGLKIWDYNTIDGYTYCRKLQDWNIRRELGVEPNTSHKYKIDISPCSRYVAVLMAYRSHIILKDVRNNGKTVKSVRFGTGSEDGRQIMFSNIDGPLSIFIRSWYDADDNGNGNENEIKSNIIRTWRPYDVADDDDDPGHDTTTRLVTMPGRHYRQLDNEEFNFAISHDNSMIAIHSEEQMGCKLMLYSIDNDTKSATLKHSFRAVRSNIRFTRDDNYISYNNNHGLAFWNITTGKEISLKIKITYNKRNNDHVNVVDFSPTGSGTRVLVKDYHKSGGFFIASFRDSSKVQKNRKSPRLTMN
jgi:WD40 repeat protein